MGVVLTPIVQPRQMLLTDLRSKTLAVDKDYDTLLFGAPRLLRFLSIAGGSRVVGLRAQGDRGRAGGLGQDAAGAAEKARIQTSHSKKQRRRTCI